eukprot:8365289-Heterocapsa_arctica.AAC.1
MSWSEFSGGLGRTALVAPDCVVCAGEPFSNYPPRGLMVGAGLAGGGASCQVDCWRCLMSGCRTPRCAGCPRVARCGCALLRGPGAAGALHRGWRPAVVAASEAWPPYPNAAALGHFQIPFHNGPGDTLSAKPEPLAASLALWAVGNVPWVCSGHATVVAWGTAW